MTLIGILQLTLYVIVLLVLVKPLGSYMARVFEGRTCGLDRVLGPLESFIYKLCGLQPTREMNWREYAGALLLFNALGYSNIVWNLASASLLASEPPGHAPGACGPGFQYRGQFYFQYQLAGVWRGNHPKLFHPNGGVDRAKLCLRGHGDGGPGGLDPGPGPAGDDRIGNFWVDLVRSTLYILLPLSLVFAVALVSQGVVQTFRPYPKVALVQPLEVQKTVEGLTSGEKPKTETSLQHGAGHCRGTGGFPDCH